LRVYRVSIGGLKMKRKRERRVSVADIDRDGEE